MIDRPAILLIGCGRMGAALARGLVDDFALLVHDPVATLPDGAIAVPDLVGAAANHCIEAVIVAVKPQIFASLAPQIAPFAEAGRLVVSIMAGIRLEQLGAAFGARAALVRAMPNTPAAIGAGITAILAGASVNAVQRKLAMRIFAPTGAALWLEHEADLDTVTALSGSGPAYFFRFAEALIEGAIAQGLDHDTATILARQTMIGAAALAQASPATLGELRGDVTSPGGTTAAGLAVLDKGAAVDRLAREVIAAAATRSRELAG